MVERCQVVQSLLDLFESPTYLEIGVNEGVTFHAAKAARKVAVDPKFCFEHQSRAETSCEYHETTSDIYFGSIASPLDRFDVIYLDGLHTFEQTLRDLLNALQYRSDLGVVLVDDVLPNSYEASLPDQRLSSLVRSSTKREDPSWMGDVFKLVFFVETFLQQFSYSTTQDNHGQLVLWPKRREVVPFRDLRSLAELQFSDVITKAPEFRIQPLATIIQELKAGRSGC